MQQAEHPALILASGSAARADLLRAAGLAFTIHPVAVDEAAIKQAAQEAGASPDDAALLLAQTKAACVDNPDALVIGADQLLVCEGVWFDKPADLAQARAQLCALRGRRHVLHSAVVCRRQGRMVWQHVGRPVLQMRAFSDAFLGAYLAAEGTALLSCVGAYRAEGLGMQLFEDIAGAAADVLGLPMLPLLGFLRQHGVLPM